MLLWNFPHCYHYTVIVSTTLNPSLTRSFVACWSFPNHFSVCAMLTNCFQALKCVKLCVTQTWHTRVWEDRGTRAQKALRPVTFRSRHVSKVSQVINNCGWSSRPAAAQYQQRLAETSIISNDSWASPADGKTHSEVVSTVMLMFLCRPYVSVTMVILVWM